MYVFGNIVVVVVVFPRNIRDTRRERLFKAMTNCSSTNNLNHHYICNNKNNYYYYYYYCCCYYYYYYYYYYCYYCDHYCYLRFVVQGLRCQVRIEAWCCRCGVTFTFWIQATAQVFLSLRFLHTDQAIW